MPPVAPDPLAAPPKASGRCNAAHPTEAGVDCERLPGHPGRHVGSGYNWSRELEGLASRPATRRR